MAAETWVAGDPLMPDNGCGQSTSIHMTAPARAAVIAEGGSLPPWWRPPADDEQHGMANRRCDPCAVTWRGSDTCWACGQVPA